MESIFLQPKYPETKVFLYGHRVDRDGDISLLKKIADFLVEKRIFRKENLFLGSNCDLSETSFFKKSDYHIAVIPKHSDQELLLDLIDQTKDCVCQILCVDSCSLTPLLTGLPTLLLTEYNYERLVPPFSGTWILSHTLGIPPKVKNSEKEPSIGILLSEDLLQWGKLPEEEKRFRRAELLQELSFKELLLDGMESKEFFEKNRLFLGYAESDFSYGAFISAMLTGKSSGEKKLWFILPGFNATIYQHNFLSIQTTSHGKFSTHRCLIQQGTEIRILTGKVAPEEMFILWKICEEEVLTTGDQSTGEALAAKKKIVYSLREMSHKSKFAERLNDWFSIPSLTLSYSDKMSFPSYSVKQPSDSDLKKIDFSSRFKELVDQLVRISRPKIPCLLHEPTAHQHLDSFPPGMPVFVSGKQVSDMRMTREGEVTNPAFKEKFTGVKFEYALVGLGVWALTRRVKVQS